MIVLDTTILVYAVGADHPLAEPCRRLVQAVGDGLVRATTTPEALQEFVWVRAARRNRADAADLARSYAQLLSPLLVVERSHLDAGLELFVNHAELGSFDAVLAAAALDRGVDALVSADMAFACVPSLRHLDPASRELTELLES